MTGTDAETEAAAPQAEPAVEVQSEKGLWHYIGMALSGALLLLVVALAVMLIVVPKVAGGIPLTVLTSSMEPRLPPGTLIVVRPVNPDDLRIGDVVTYQIRSGKPGVITHRIIAIAAVLLLSYAGYMIASGTVTAAKNRRRPKNSTPNIDPT